MLSQHCSCLSDPESTLQAILETAVDGIVVIDPQGTIVAANNALRTIFGYSQEELQQQPVSMLMPEPYRSNHQSFIDRYIQSGLGQIIGIGAREVPGLRSDGTVIPLELGVSEVRTANHRLFAAILRDISDRKAAQKALMDSYLDLEHKQKLLDQDLEAAAKIQFSLLPHSQPNLDNLEVGWIFEPSIKIGGDIFNLVPLSQDHLGIYILDVSGHGVPSALVAVSVAQVMQREGCLLKGDWMEPNCELTVPSEVLEHLDSEFPLERFGTYFTMSYLVLNVHTGRLQFSNAGHPYPLIIRKSGEVITLETEGTVIGLGGMMPFSTGVISIYPGDLLVLYTDGLFEQTNAAGCQFGWEEMCRALVDSRHLPAQEIAATIQESVRRFAAHRALEDDISLICLKYSQL
jgi:sigma-B regulation protein RsbU (phosphoserine phosphatase)